MYLQFSSVGTVGFLWTNVLYSLIIMFEMVLLSVNFTGFGGYGNQTAEMQFVALSVENDEMEIPCKVAITGFPLDLENLKNDSKHGHLLKILKY